MKIAQIAPIAERVPPKKYGGTERVVHALTEELVKRGHQVTLFASGDSITSANLISPYPVSLREANLKDVYGLNTYDLLNIAHAYSRQKEFDVIHDHTPNLSMPAANIASTPVVLTHHGPYKSEIIEYFSAINGPKLTSISNSQAELAPGLKFFANVYNGLPMETYPFSAGHDDYLLFVGRVDMEKGLHLAMDVARRINKKLVVAAKLDNQIPHIKRYYQRYIVPRRRKYAPLIEWIGEVDETQRNELMKNALCLLHPVTWPEPFGLTMIEAMACGCPVVAFNRGSIPEVIVQGKTGFIVEGKNPKKLAEIVVHLDIIDRAECRRYALETFSAKKMADGYEAVYRALAKGR
jgi:glycosyltransferase involved in cell wall biosynthesis